MSKKEEFSLKPRLHDGMVVLDASNRVVRHNRALVQALSDPPREDGLERLNHLLAEPSVLELVARARQGEIVRPRSHHCVPCSPQNCAMDSALSASGPTR